MRAAQQRGAKELECPGASTEVSSKETVDEAQTTDWYEPPYRALFSINVSGCGKQTEYLVACNSGEERCVAGSPLIR